MAAEWTAHILPHPCSAVDRTPRKVLRQQMTHRHRAGTPRNHPASAPVHAGHILRVVRPQTGGAALVNVVHCDVNHSLSNRTTLWLAVQFTLGGQRFRSYR
jgi:hypothetical protein